MLQTGHVRRKGHNSRGQQREDGVLLSELSCCSLIKLRTEKDKLGVVLPGVLRPADLEFKVILS